MRVVKRSSCPSGSPAYPGAASADRRRASRGARPEPAEGQPGEQLGREGRFGAGRWAPQPLRAEPPRLKALGMAAVTRLPGAGRGSGLRNTESWRKASTSSISQRL